MIKLRLHSTEQHQPRQNWFCHKAQDDISSFAIQIILPLADALVLQDHVDRESIEGNKIGADDCPNEPRDHVKIAGAEHIQQDRNPGSDASDRAPHEGTPFYLSFFLTASVVRQKTKFGFDLLPSSALMAAIEESLEPGDEMILRERLSSLQDEYDFILIDTPPGKAALAFNGIVAADLLMVPASAERMSVDGISDLVNHVQEIFWHKFQDELKQQEIRVLFTMYKANTKHSPGVVQAARRIYQNNVLNIQIPETIEFPRSFDKRMPLINLLPNHPGTKQYIKLAKWIIDNA